MNTLKLTDDLYWNGIQDPQLRTFDIIMETKYGTSYNSYILKGSEKTVLIETAKLKFYDIYKKKLDELIDIKDIDYIIVNHTEPDHAGSIEHLLDINPNIQIVGTNAAINFVKQIVNHDFKSIVVKDNDTLSLGDKTLRFMPLPNLHWPDTMYTFWEEGHVLFTCDSFGAHYSHPQVLRSTVTDVDGYLSAAKYYFDNIIGPYKSPFMTNALERIKDFKIDMICTGHGPVLDSNIKEIIELNKEWCKSNNTNTKKTVIVPYVSAYGYTESLAKSIKSGIEASGDIDVRLYNMETADKAHVVEELGYCDGMLMGTPTILGDALEPIWQLTLCMCSAVHKGKLASAFGSYGWSGEGVPNIIARLTQLKLKVIDGFRIKLKPSATELDEAFAFGKNFGEQLLNK
ncbi:MAG: FprA family A-type flavoprotein [Lachnospiraceae bacterium]|nr:FprA family A-type flavoprotein [Lachnospiraceae bacterium]